MKTVNFSSLKIDKTTITTAPLFDNARLRQVDIKNYWRSRTPQERLRYVETLRRMNYGHRASTRLQRVLKITQHSWG